MATSKNTWVKSISTAFLALLFSCLLLTLSGGVASAYADSTDDPTVITQADMPESGCYELGSGSYELGSDIDGGFKVTGDATLDMKNHIVTNSANQGVFSLISDKKSLTVSNGTVIQNNTENAAFRNDGGSSLTLESITATSNNHVCIDNESGTTRIKSGTYTVKNSIKNSSLIRVADGRIERSYLEIYGGTFLYEGNKPTNLINVNTQPGFTYAWIHGGCFALLPSKARFYNDSLVMLKTGNGFEVVGESQLEDLGAIWKVSDISDSNMDAYFSTTADKDEFINAYSGKAEPYKGYTVKVSTNIEGKSASILVARGEKISKEDLISGLDLDERYLLDSVKDSEGNTYDFDSSVDSDLELTANLKQVVAYIGENGYESLNDAVKAVNNNEIIRLCDKVTEDAYANNGKTFTIDLNGKTLSAKSENEPALHIARSSKVTVKNGTISASSNAVYIQGDMYGSVDSNVLNLDGVTATSSSAAAIRAEFSKVTIDGGSYVSKSSSDATESSTAFYVYGATAVINSGTFTGSDSAKNAVSLNYHGTLTINGGTFVNQIKVNSGTLTVNGGTFETYANLANIAEGKALLKHKGADYEVVDTAAAMAAARCVVADSLGRNLYFEDADEAASYAKEISGSSTTTVCHVSFNSDGGTAVATQDVLSGGLAVEPDPAPTKEGYTFAGWTLDGEDYAFNAPVAADIELKAKWTINKYTVAFLNDDGSSFDSQEVEYGKTVSAPKESPTKEGSVFGAWMLDGQVYDFKTPVKCDITLTPSWNQIYTVSFVDEDKTTVLADPQKIESGKCATAPDPAPTKDGYDFVGWTLNGESFSFDAPITGDTTLVASWKIKSYTVTFDSNGGSNVDSQTIEHGKCATEPDSVPTKEGYEFNAWQLDGKDFDFANTPITQDVALKAAWTAKTYTVTFDTDGGSAAPAEQKVEYGKLATEPEAPTKEGQGFSGWCVTDEEGKALYPFYFGIPITGDLKLKARWSTPVAEADGKQYASLGYAVHMAQSGSTVKLIAQPKENVDFIQVADKNLVIDLGGFTLSGYDDVVEVSGGSKVTLKNGSVEFTDYYGIYLWSYSSEDSSELTLKDVTVSFSGESSSGSDDLICVAGNAKLHIESGTYQASSGNAIYQDGGTVDISGGEFSGVYEDENSALYIASGTCEINGGTFNDMVYVSNDDESTKLVIYGGKFGAADNYQKLASGKAFLKAAASDDAKGYYEVVGVEDAKKEAVAKVGLDGAAIYFKDASEAADFAVEHEGATLTKYVTASISEPENLVYDGTAKEAKAELEGVDDADKDKLSAVVEYEYPDGSKTEAAPVNAGSYTAKVSSVTGDTESNYELRNEESCEFAIAPASLSDATVNLKPGTWTYDGTKKEPEVDSVVLGDNTLASDDYAVSYSDNINAGKATVTVAGKGNYEGEAERTFDIDQAAASITAPESIEKTAGDPDFDLGAKASTEVEGGSAVQLAYESSNGEVATVGNDGRVSVHAAGSATITVSAAEGGNYTAETKQVNLTVKAAPAPAPTPVSTNISAAKVTLSKTSFTYNGKAQKPSVKSVVLNGKTLKAGTDYTASIASGKKVGTYAVTVTAKGSYTGKASTSFVVNPKGVTKLKVSKAKKSFKAKWKKSKTERSGVQVKYSTKKSMKNAKTVKAKGASVKAKKVKKLKKKTKYYVQVRAYKTVGGKTYYSGWSAKKAVKTK